MSKCPHCLVTIHDHVQYIYIGTDADGEWALLSNTCPACDRLVLHLVNGSPNSFIVASPRVLRGIGNADTIKSYRLVRPRTASRNPCPPDVPQDVAKDYNKAALTLEDSPEASSALSRRCLQSILRGIGGVKPGNLANEIQEALDRHNLPSHIAEQIDAIRNVGNFAAHPIKSQSAGTIIDVEPQEAEWNLDVLELLFDFYYVQPALAAQKRAELNKKLQDAATPPMK